MTLVVPSGRRIAHSSWPPRTKNDASALQNEKTAIDVLMLSISRRKAAGRGVREMRIDLRLADAKLRQPERWWTTQRC